MHIAKHKINRVGGQKINGCLRIEGAMTPKFPILQPVGQSLTVLEILSDEQGIPFGDRHLVPPRHCAFVGGGAAPYGGF